jgi:hypothetical protein
MIMAGSFKLEIRPNKGLSNIIMQDKLFSDNFNSTAKNSSNVNIS